MSDNVVAHDALMVGVNAFRAADDGQVFGEALGHRQRHITGDADGLYRHIADAELIRADLPEGIRIEIPGVEIEGGQLRATNQRVVPEAFLPVGDGRSRNLPLADVNWRSAAGLRAIALQSLGHGIEGRPRGAEVGAVVELVGYRC